jgi:hypothetical protein
MTSNDSAMSRLVPGVAGGVALVVGAVIAGWVTAPAAGWFATALVLLGAWGASRAWPLTEPLLDRIPPRWRERGVSALPYALVAVVVAWATWPAVLGEVPMSQDHAHHYLQTAIFTDDLLARGHLFGWTERIGTGLPFGDVYATAVYVVTGFLRIVSFGLVSRATSYAVGIYLVWLIPAWAIVAWTRRLCDEIVEARGAAILGCVAAAALFVVDLGTDREGGWVYSMFHAVWPQIVGTGMWLWAMLAMVRLVERPTTRRLGVATIVAGFAFWAHPMNAMNLVVTAPILFVAAMANRSPGPGDDDSANVVERASGWWLVPAFALAAVVGFAWMAHMIVASDLMASFTAYGDPLREYARRVWESGTPFKGGLAVTGIAALFGLAAATLRGGVARHASALGVVVFVALASTDLLASTDFGLHDAAPFIMFKRFIITAKPLYFALAGLGLGVALDAAWRQRERLGPAATALGLLVASPIVWSGLQSLPEMIRTPDARFLTADEVGVDESLGQIVGIIDRELDSTPGPKRVLVWHGRGDTGDYALFAIAELGVGYLPTRTPPAQAYSELGLVTDLEMVSMLGASHIISRDARKFPGARLLGELPPYKLWRINNTPGDGVRAFGSSAVLKTVEWEPMRHVVEVSNHKGKGELVFGIPPHPKWTFSQNGKQLETKPYRYGRQAELTQVLGFSNGEVVAEYHDTTTERVAFVLMLLVLVLAIAGIAWNRALPLVPEAWRDRAAHAALLACVLLAVVTGLVVQRMGASALDDAWAKDKGERVLAALHRQKPLMDYAPKPFCMRPMSRNPRVGCDNTQLEPRLRLSKPRNQKSPTCMELLVPDDGFLELRWSVPAGTTRVKGRFDGRMGGVVPKLRIDGNERLVHGNDIDHQLNGDTFWMRLDNQNRRTEKVCLELVAIGAE